MYVIAFYLISSVVCDQKQKNMTYATTHFIMKSKEHTFYNLILHFLKHKTSTLQCKFTNWKFNNFFLQTCCLQGTKKSQRV